MGTKNAVLIVDDEAPFRDMMRGYLKDRGFKVHCAEGAEQAVAAMTRVHMKVVLLDYQMPKINGDDLIGKLQHINPEARFIIVSGMTDADVEQKFSGLGYFAFIHKGALSLEKLESLIYKALDD